MGKSNIVEYKEFLYLESEKTELELEMISEMIKHRPTVATEAEAFELMADALEDRSEVFRDRKADFWRRMKEKYSLNENGSFIITNDFAFESTISDGWLQD